MSPFDGFDYEGTPVRCSWSRTRRYRGALFVTGAEAAFELNELGEFVFRQIDGRTAVRDIAARLAGTYGLTNHDALVDTSMLIVELVRHRVISFVGDGA